MSVLDLVTCSSPYLRSALGEDPLKKNAIHQNNLSGSGWL